MAHHFMNPRRTLHATIERTQKGLEARDRRGLLPGDSWIAGLPVMRQPLEEHGRFLPELYAKERSDLPDRFQTIQMVRRRRSSSRTRRLWQRHLFMNFTRRRWPGGPISPYRATGLQFST